MWKISTGKKYIYYRVNCKYVTSLYYIDSEMKYVYIEISFPFGETLLQLHNIHKLKHVEFLKFIRLYLYGRTYG